MNGNERAAILIVDDEPSVSDILSRWLVAEGHAAARASNGAEALEALRDGDFALVVTDIMMPGMTGLELLREVGRLYPRTAVIMLTGLDDRATATEALHLGAYGYMLKPFEENEVLINVTNALQRRSLEIMRDRYEERLEEEVRARTVEVRRTQEEITLRLTTASEYRDEETGTHIRRMGLYAARLAEGLGCDRKTLLDIRLAAPMHDVGKIGVPDGILQKPGRLTPEEFEEIMRHPAIGAHILESSSVPLLGLAREIALCHHEKWDGSGYPGHLRGDTIPLRTRIVAVADVYDALVSDRVYRKALPEEEALEIMRQGRGVHFDPRVYDCFREALPDFHRIRREIDAATPKDKAEEVSTAP